MTFALIICLLGGVVYAVCEGRNVPAFRRRDRPAHILRGPRGVFVWEINHHGQIQDLQRSGPDDG